MNWIYYLLVFMAGIGVTMQAGVNSLLRTAVASPLTASFISFLTGTILLGIAVLFTQKAIPAISDLSQIEWYKYSGGLLGAFFVTVVVVSSQKMGSANLFALMITGQLITALVFDHFALLGFKESLISPPKIIGIILLVGGAYLINKK
jgi:transporter family-2 protein